MKQLGLMVAFLFVSNVYAGKSPTRYTELLDYVQEAPDQGETGACLFMASTGAMELIANKKAGIKDPQPYGKYDLSESFLINAPFVDAVGKYFIEQPVLKFNAGYGIHIKDWPFDAWRDSHINTGVWDAMNVESLPHIALPKVKTIPLFVFKNRWATNVLEDSHINMIKDALLKHQGPVLVNYNDNDYWHVVLIVGFDDKMPGDCYQIPEENCKTLGSFYVRDSFGVPVVLRDYDWFRIKGNAAIVIKEAE